MYILDIETLNAKFEVFHTHNLNQIESKLLKCINYHLLSTNLEFENRLSEFRV